MVVCNFCQSIDLESVYQVIESPREAEVKVCKHCGLVQSIFVKPKLSQRIASVSSGADWGNVRHGKGLRLKAAIPLISSVIPLDRLNSVLDIGSNRGNFILWLNELYPNLNITGVEPDSTIINDYKNTSNFILYQDTLENVTFSTQYFDFIYCSHTLEHAESASIMLKKIHKLLVTGGYLFLEVPNLDVLCLTDTVEEFFIDKHRFHFQRDILIEYLRYLGFNIILGKDDYDSFNITIVAVKSEGSDQTKIFDYQSDIERIKTIINNYQIYLEKNRQLLQEVAEIINKFMLRQKVVFWGGGKIFDALIKYGKLNTDKLLGVVDEYLYKVFPIYGKILIQNPSQIKMLQPDVVIVLARSSSNEIIEKVRKLGVKNVIKFQDILQSLT